MVRGGGAFDFEIGADSDFLSDFCSLWVYDRECNDAWA